MLLQLIVGLGLERQIRLMGPLLQADVRRELTRADVFVLACRTTLDGDTDGIPVSLNGSGYAPGLASPTVASIPQMVAHGATARLGPEQAEATFASNIAYALSNGPNRELMIASARNKIESKFDQFAESGKLPSILLRRFPE